MEVLRSRSRAAKMRIAGRVRIVEGVVVELHVSENRGPAHTQARAYSVVHDVVPDDDVVLGPVSEIDAVLAHTVDDVVMDADVVDVRIPLVRLDAVATGDFLDTIVGNLVGTVAADVDAVVFQVRAAVRLVVHVVYVVADPIIVDAVTGDSACPATGADLTAAHGQLVVDHPPVRAQRVQ